MAQLSFLEKCKAKIKSCRKQKVHYWKVFFDGASRNNPGPAGAGLYILKDGKPFLKNGFYLGIKTNNQAEYLGLLLGVFYAKKQMAPCDILLIISDSQLLVRQMEGVYKVKNPELRPMFQLANRLLSGINYSVLHVLRDENKDADEMANIGIDKKNKLPKDFVDMLHENQIIL